MSTYRLVERRDGGGEHYPIIQAVLTDDDWFPPVQAFQYQPSAGDPYWLLIVDPRVMAKAGLDQLPAAAVLADARQARDWVALLAGLYVEASK